MIRDLHLETTIFNYGAIVIFCTSLIVNFVFFIVLTSRFRSTKVKALQLLMLTSIFDIIIEIISLFQAFTVVDVNAFLSANELVKSAFGIT